ELEARTAQLMDAAPFGVAVLFSDAMPSVNPVGARIFGAPALMEDAPADEWQQSYRFFREDHVTPIPVHELAGVRAMGGAEIEGERMWVAMPEGGGAMIAIAATPLPGHASVTIVRDVTARAALERDLEERRTSLEERDAENKA